MKTTIKLAKFGNSKGIRLNKDLLQRYQIHETVEWSTSYQQMAASDEDGTEWDAVADRFHACLSRTHGYL